MFKSARIQLTLWYLLIITVIVAIFSSAIYSFLSLEIERFEHSQRLQLYRGLPVPVPVFDPQLLEETRRRVQLRIVLVDLGVIALSGGLAGFLAGRTLAPIKVMLDEQNRFISDASHELRTPLTALKSSLEVYLRDKKPTLASARELISGSLSDVNRMQYLSDSLLKLIQYQKPKGQPLSVFPLPEIIAASVRKVQPQADSRTIAIRTDAPDIKLRGDKYSLEELLIILLDNAVKYSPPDSTVTLLSKKIDGHVEIKVSDSGIGINPKDLPHIFDRFYRADSARTQSGSGGYGLGLSIAKKIVDQHHGTIAVKSKPRSGTTFTVTFHL